MQYRALSPEAGTRVLDLARTGKEIPSGSVETRGKGKALADAVLPKLASKLAAVKKHYPSTIGTRDPNGGRFEAEVCVLVHEAIPFDAEMLADYDFWTWLAVVHFREVVEWRHGGKAGTAAWPNFGIGKRDENLLYRLWLRAELGFDQGAKDPYARARVGDQDFWRSHLFRQGYSAYRNLVNALIDFQYPTSKKGAPTLVTDEIRDLAKRLRRVNANLMFDALDAEAARKLVEREAAAAKLGVGQEEK